MPATPSASTGQNSGTPAGPGTSIPISPGPDILLYHVVPGIYTVADLRQESGLESAQGQTLRLETTREGLTINGTYMLTSDVRASNGIIHVITQVLVPES